MDQFGPCTRDLREDRVRVMIDRENIVQQVPFVG